MRKIKAHIKTSPNGNLFYNLYRSTKEESLPESANILATLDPLMVIDESKVEVQAIMMFEEEGEMKTSSVIKGNLVPYSTKHKILRDMLHSVIVRITYSNKVSKMFAVKFDNKTAVLSVTDGDDKIYDSSESISIGANTIVYIHDSLLVDAVKVNTSYYTEVFEVIDSKDEQAGVTIIGEPATGISPSVLSKQNKTVTLYPEYIVPYFQLQAAVYSEPLRYFYRLLAKDEANNISDPSELMWVDLEQSNEEVDYFLQYSNSTKGLLNTKWEDTEIKMISAQTLDFGKNGTKEFTDFGNIFNGLPTKDIDSNSVRATFSTEGTPSVTLFFDNPWEDVKYKAKTTKSFRLKGILVNDPDAVVYSETLQAEEAFIGLDTVLVRRKEIVDLLNDKVAAPLEGEGAVSVATFIKFNGANYHAITKSDPGKLDEDTLNVGVFQKPMNYALMTDNSGNLELGVIDIDVANGKAYRYTIYVKDDTGQYTPGTSYDVTCA